MNNAHKSAVLLLPLIFSACSATMYEGKYDFSKGWRPGTVLSLDVASVRDRSAVDCREVLPADDMATTRFVYVSYFIYGGHRRKVIAAVDSSTVLQVGDEVYLRVKDCAQRLVPAQKL